jgi:hypothetical protein
MVVNQQVLRKMLHRICKRQWGRTKLYITSTARNQVVFAHNAKSILKKL